MTPGDHHTQTVVRIAAADLPEDVAAPFRAREDVAVTATGSVGVAHLEPAVAVARGDETAVHLAVDAETAGDVAAGIGEDDGPPPEYVAETEGDAFPVPDTGPLAVGERTILAGLGWRDPTDPEDYRDAGGFVGVGADERAAYDAAEGIAGRGWGDWARDDPVGATWREAAAAEGDPVVVVNAHGNEVDRLLLSGDPFAVLDGAALAAAAVDATEIRVFLDASDGQAVERARTAADDLPGDVPASVTAGPDRAVAAEPTMAIEALEGSDRLEARLRPPGPATTGLEGRPTVVHTARTLARVAAAGRGEAVDTRAVTVQGDVAAPVVVELPTHATLADAVEAADVDGSVKAVVVGDPFGGVTPDLDVSLEEQALADAGLGTGGPVEVLAEDRCIVEAVREYADEAAERNCGRCVPCREGSTQLEGLLADQTGGSDDRAGIAELARVARGSSICAFGRDLARPVETAMDAFEAEFAAHARGECPAGVCTEPMEATL